MFGKKKKQQNEDAPVMTPDSGRLLDDDATAKTEPDDLETPLTKTEDNIASAESLAEAADASSADQADRIEPQAKTATEISEAESESELEPAWTEPIFKTEPAGTEPKQESETIEQELKPEFSEPEPAVTEPLAESLAPESVPAERLQRSGQKGKAKKKAKEAEEKAKGVKKTEKKPKKSMKSLMNQDVSLKKMSLKDISISKASLKNFLSKSNGKDPYPVKTDMNLMKRPTMDKIMPNVVVYGILSILVVILLLMLAIFGPLSNYKELLDDYDTTQATLDSYTQKLQDYAEVEKQYQIYSYGYLSEEEATLVDRLDILSLLDSCAGSRGKVTAVGIAGNTVAVTLNVSSLQVVSAVLADLYRSPYVTAVTVNNAANQDSSITSNMVIQVANPSEDGEPAEPELPGEITEGTEGEVQ